MKQSLIAISLLTLIISSCEPGKEDMKADYVKGCNESADKSTKEPKIRAIMHEYCECSGDKIVNTFTHKEIVEMNEMRSSGKSAEVEAKMMPAIEACTNDMQAKIMKAAEEGIPLE